MQAGVCFWVVWGLVSALVLATIWAPAIEGRYTLSGHFGATAGLVVIMGLLAVAVISSDS